MDKKITPETELTGISETRLREVINKEIDRRLCDIVKAISSVQSSEYEKATNKNRTSDFVSGIKPHNCES